MDFRELKYITTVADCRSITKAAAQLYVSQPSLSHLIAKVEKEVGVKLFDRTAYPIKLTYAGERYIETARKILQLDDNVKREFMDISEGRKGRITVGMPTERAGYMLPGILQEFKKEYPGIEVSLFEGSSETLIDSVIKGQTNVIILPKTAEHHELQSQIIYQEELFLVINDQLMKEVKGYVIDKKSIQLDEVSEFPFILQKKGHAIRKAIEKLFRTSDLSLRGCMETHSSINAATLAVSGAGAAIVPKRAMDIVKAAADYHVYSIGDDRVTWDVVAFYRKDTYLDKAEKRFIEIAREVFS